MPSKRKSYQFHASETKFARQFAALEGVSISSLFAEWIAGFVENGSDYQAGPHDGEIDIIQIIIDPDLLAKAEQKALAEYDVDLKEILRFEMSEISKL